MNPRPPRRRFAAALHIAPRRRFAAALHLQPVLLIALLASAACSNAPQDEPTPTPGDKLPTTPTTPAVTMPIGAGGTTAMTAGSSATPSTPSTPMLPGIATGGSGGTNAMTAGSSANAGSAAVAAGSGAVAGGSGVAGSTSPSSGGSNAQLKITAHAIPPSGEQHICVVLPLPNEQRAFITSIHATLTPGSHHLIVDRSPVGTATQSTEAPCVPTQGTDATRLMIAQQRDTMLTMPAGTALAVEPHQPVFLQLHYINLDTKTLDIVGSIDVTFADPAGPALTEVQSLFTGATSLSIKAGQDGLGEFFFKPGSSAKPWHVFALTSHTHSLGTESTIERVASNSAPAATPLHDSLDWHEPPLTTFDPPLVFDGSDGLRLRCHYHNDTDHDVSFGTRFEDEMCFLWLYYY